MSSFPPMSLAYCSNSDSIFQQDFVSESTFYPSAQDEAAARLFDDIIHPHPELYCDDFGAQLPADHSYFNVEPHPENIIPLPTTPPSHYHDPFLPVKRQKLIVEDVVTQPAKRSLSLQSITARQRRRKISEKTHELGKLIPGAMKMNTAEMFGAAYKYIQYLQAQAGILEFMANSTDHQELLHDLLDSTSIQEKLYSTEKCMVPREFVQELANERTRGYS